MKNTEQHKGLNDPNNELCYWESMYMNWIVLSILFYLAQSTFPLSDYNGGSCSRRGQALNHKIHYSIE